VRLWNADSGVCTHVLNPDATGPIDGVTCVAIRPDASLVAAASIDRTVHLWRASDGHVIYRLVRCVHMRTSNYMHILTATCEDALRSTRGSSDVRSNACSIA
jgi:WD40 repeat protein